eukprot:TRINITY_DN9752_c0_g2_i1.p1 TRINITY_DN9752_c0_g2~~TRINITY_DN9752_c0_g2_i1.p1  ORF type:complete len:621 (+),score=135.57 TRINITY_DN9752_c0_g2_i1:440-2302(+)
MLYSKKFGISAERMTAKLWGPHFFDPSSKKWVTSSESTNCAPLRRGFVQFILEPIRKLAVAILEGKDELYKKMVDSLGIPVQTNTWNLSSVELLQEIFSLWLPVRSSVLDSFLNCLPTAVDAQRYRNRLLVQGEHFTFESPGPELFVYIAGCIPVGSKLFSFGRVFSGEINKDDVAIVITEEYKGDDDVPCWKTDSRNFGEIYELVGNAVQANEKLGPSNLLVFPSISGSERIIVSKELESLIPCSCKRISCQKIFSVSLLDTEPSPIREALKVLIRCVNVTGFISAQGEMLLCSDVPDTLHEALNILKRLIPDRQVRHSELRVECKESIDSPCSIICSSKSPNKHNRVYFHAEPLDEDSVQKMSRQKLRVDNAEHKESGFATKFLARGSGGSVESIMKPKAEDQFDVVWSFGSPECPENALIARPIREAKDLREWMQAGSLIAFKNITSASPLSGYPLRGVLFRAIDAFLFADAIHRGVGQIIPAVQRAMTACLLKSDPILVEPMMLCSITMSRVCWNEEIVKSRRGQIVTYEDCSSFQIVRVECLIPGELCAAFRSVLTAEDPDSHCEFVFSHWQRMSGEDAFILREGSRAHRLALEHRLHLGMSGDLPRFDDMVDRH